MKPRSQKNFDGVRAAAETLNLLDKAHRDLLLKKMQEKNPELAEKVRQSMILFEDLFKMDDRDFQIFLREVSQKKFILAMRNANDEFKNKVFNNLSKRAATLFQEELDRQGPQRLSQVEEAQREIVEMARDLSLKGKIRLT